MYVMKGKDYSVLLCLGLSQKKINIYIVMTVSDSVKSALAWVKKKKKKKEGVAVCFVSS